MNACVHSQQVVSNLALGWVNVPVYAPEFEVEGIYGSLSHQGSFSQKCILSLKAVASKRRRVVLHY